MAICFVLFSVLFDMTHRSFDFYDLLWFFVLIDNGSSKNFDVGNFLTPKMVGSSDDLS